MVEVEQEMMLEEGARMTEWDTHEACPGYIEVEDRRIANKNHEGVDDILDRTGYELVVGGLHGNVVPHFPRCCLALVRLRVRGQPPWVGKDQQKELLSSNKLVDAPADDVRMLGIQLWLHCVRGDCEKRNLRAAGLGSLAHIRNRFRQYQISQETYQNLMLNSCLNFDARYFVTRWRPM